MTQKHECPALQARNTGPAFRVAIVGNSGSWLLRQQSRAIDLDVKAGEAKAVGELLEKNELAISFCPYCGESLQ
jgi:hypothetical protein